MSVIGVDGYYGIEHSSTLRVRGDIVAVNLGLEVIPQGWTTRGWSTARILDDDPDPDNNMTGTPF